MRTRTWMIGLTVLAVVGSLTTGCRSTPSRSEVLAKIAELPAKHLSSYRFDPSTPVIDRAGPAPSFLIDYLERYDRTDAYSPYAPSPSELRLLQRDLDLLPRSYRVVFKSRLVGVYFVSNFLGSGMTDYVLDGDGHLYFALFINPATMKHNASDWLTVRERSAFSASEALAPGSGSGGGAGQIDVKIDCGTQYTGLLYILLHEGGHMIDYLEHATPYVDWSIQALGEGVGPTDFTSSVWRSYGRPRGAYDFRYRSDLHFYGLGKAIPVSRAPALYRGLERSPFASLYGSENWAEDFAEQMTWYYWTHTLHQPYAIELHEDGEFDLRYEPMSSPLVLRRAETVAAFATENFVVSY